MDNAILCLLLLVSYAALMQAAQEETCQPSCCCCDINKLELDFSDGTVIGDKAAFGAIDYVSMTSGSTCDRQLVLNVTFDEPPQKEMKCQAECGRRMLKVRMNIAAPGNRTGYIFNIGNSRSNNGHKGDGTHTSYDSEVDGKNENMEAHGNDACPDTSISYQGAMDTCVTVWIGTGFYRIENSTGLVGTQCNDTCFYELSRSPNDIERNGINDLGVFLGFNRVVLPNSPRTGSGVCSATLSWECMWEQPCGSQGESQGESTGKPKE